MLALYNNVKVFTSTTGTGTLTAGAAVTGFQTPSSANVQNGQRCRIRIETSAGGWELSTSTYSTSGTTFTRTLIESSTGSLLDLTSATTNTVAITMVYQDHVSQIIPQGRLTLTASTPVMTASATAQTTVRYSPYCGSWVPIYDGTSWTIQQFSELSQATTDATKSPAACGTHRNYDMFVWDDAGTLRCTRGPEWTQAQTFTVTIASPAVFSLTAHGFYEGMPVIFSTTGALPTGLTAGTTYFIITAGLTANAFEVSATVGGSAVNTSGSQSGVHTATQNATVRGTGAGTTELTRVNGMFVNANAITNGPGAQKGLYVGTIRTNGSSQIDMIFGGVGVAGGESCNLGVWNAFNRVNMAFKNFDTTDTWTYSTSGYRLKNLAASTTANRTTFVTGLIEEAISAIASTTSSNSTGGAARATAVGMNSTTTAFVGSSSHRATNGVNEVVGMSGALYSLTTLGASYVAPLEDGGGAGTVTWYGDNGGLLFYSTFLAMIRA